MSKRTDNKVTPLSEHCANKIYDPAWPEQVAKSLRAAEAAGEFEEARCLQVNRRCFLTGKRLFFKKAVRATFLVTTPGWISGRSIYSDHEIWICRREYLMLKLRF